VSDEQLILPDGVRVGTGLLVPERRPVTFSPLRDSVEILSTGQIADILDEPTRALKRNFFPADKYVNNQGALGSCNGHAGAGALTKARVLRGLPFVKLSGTGLYAQINDGKDQGSMLDDGMHAMSENGVPPWDLVPNDEYRWSRISQEAKEACKDYKAFECYRVDNEMELATALALNYVCVIAVHANNAFMRLDSAGIVSSTDGPGNHAVQAIDVRIYQNELQFDMENSWGLSYGTQGRGWVSWRRHLRTTSQYHAFYAIRSTTDGPV
jgi:hypothetical protein